MRGWLDKDGGITPASLREMLSSKEFNNLSNNFRLGLSPTLKSEYKALATDDQRREWLAQYVIDPLAATTKGFNKTTAYSSQESASRLVWITEEQLGGPKYLADKAHAAIVSKAGDLPKRPHELASLAAEGIHQYGFTESWLVKNAGWRDEVGTTAKADVAAGAYEEVKSHITTSFGSAPKRKMEAKPKVAETEESKELKRLNGVRAATLRKTKQLLDRVVNDLSVCKEELAKVLAKGYPEQMTKWLDEKMLVVRVEVQHT